MNAAEGQMDVNSELTGCQGRLAAAAAPVQPCGCDITALRCMCARLIPGLCVLQVDEGEVINNDIS